MLASVWGIGHHARFGRDALGGFAPTHYLSFDKDPEVAKWLASREFRIALSHGIDRQQINETFVLGLGQTGSAAPGERTMYFPGAGVQDAPHGVRREEGQRDARQARAHQGGRGRLSPADRRRRTPAPRRQDLRRVPPVLTDR